MSRPRQSGRKRVMPVTHAALPVPLPTDQPAVAELRGLALKRLNLTVATFAGALLLLGFAVAQGRANAWASAAMAAYGAIGFLVFYVLRSRIPLTLAADQRLVFAQVIFTISLVSFTYTLVDVARAIALQLLCLIVVFDVRRLPLRQTIMAAVLAAVLPAIGLWVRWLFVPDGIDLWVSLLFLAFGSVTAPVLIVVSIEGRALLRRRAAQRDSMSRTLAQLRHLSVHDSLTGVYNRAHMADLLATHLQRQSRSKHPACLAMLDLDHFKRVNDVHGHGVGDLVLKHFARIAGESMKDTVHSLGRWGGEEFLLLMPESDREAASAALQSLHNAVREHDWAQYAAGLAVTASIGTVEIQGQTTSALVVEAADQGLYRAKAQGRDCTVWTDAAIAHAISPAAKRAAPTSPLPTALVSAVSGALPDAMPGSMASSITGAVASTTSERRVNPSNRNAFGADAEQAPSSRRGGRWLDLILTTNMAQRRELRLCLVVAAMYLMLIVANLVMPLPIELLPRDLAVVIMTMQALGAVVPFVLVRSGLTRHWADSALVVPQMLWACAAIVLGYVMIPVARAYCLQLLCVALVFGFVDLRSRQAVFMGRSVIVMLVIGYAAMAWGNASAFNAVLEGLQLLGSIAVVSLLTLLSRDFARTRESVLEESVTLAATTSQVTQAMRVDPLTSLCNRQHMQALMEQECQRHARLGTAFCIALIDLDHFKAINDSYGHGAGDEVLAGFARTATAVWRGTDVIARWGGEEFLVLLPDVDAAESALRGANRLRTTLVGATLCLGQPALRVGFSAGLACHAEHETLPHLLERADRALYEAKAQGRGRCVIAT